MFHSIEKQVSSAFHAHIQVRYGIDLAVTIEQPRQSDFGEMAVPAAFQLAKQLRQAPKKIAAELVAEIGPIPGVAAMEVAGNGYINIRLDRGVYAAALLGGPTAETAAADEKIIVEHTNINPNKAAHIGHLRNATLGDTFVRMLRAAASAWRCRTTSTTPACRWPTWWWASTIWRRRAWPMCRRCSADPAVRFDYYCWDLYARTSSYYKDHPEALPWRSATLHAIEAGEGEVAELAHLVADAIVEKHLATMLRLGVEYDVLPRESEILHLKFWAAAFELLKERKAIYFETEGKNSGLLGDAGPLRRRQGDRALRRHRGLRGQGHRLPALEVRAAGQGFLLPSVEDVCGRPRALGDHGPAGGIRGSSSGTARGSST